MSRPSRDGAATSRPLLDTPDVAARIRDLHRVVDRDRRTELETMLASVNDAAEFWLARTTSATSAAELPRGANMAALTSMSTTEAAASFNVTTSRIRQRARDEWAPRGLAVRQGRDWRINRAVLTEVTR